MRGRPQGIQRSVDRGVYRPAIEPRNILDPGADVVTNTEGYMGGREIASANPARRGQRTWHVHTLFVWEPGDLLTDRSERSLAAVRIGKARQRDDG